MGTGIIIALLTSTAAIGLAVKYAADSLVKWLKTETGLKWKPYAGYALVAVKAAEAAIPDGTANKGLAKLDFATRRFVESYEKATGETVTPIDAAQIQSVIEEAQQSLKDSGALKGGAA